MTPPGVVVWVSGPAEDATARVAMAIADRLTRRRVSTELLTPRTPGIAPLAGDGMERRVAFVAATLVRHGIAAVVAIPCPSRVVRDEIRVVLGRFIEVYVPVAARAGFEPPDRPEVRVDFPETELDGAVERAIRTLELLHYVPPADDPSYSAEEERAVIKRLKSFGYL
jgi:adenylylsulfate kinase-like enzyme